MIELTTSQLSNIKSHIDKLDYGSFSNITMYEDTVGFYYNLELVDNSLALEIVISDLTGVFAMINGEPLITEHSKELLNYFEHRLTEETLTDPRGEFDKATLALIGA